MNRSISSFLACAGVALAAAAPAAAQQYPAKPVRLIVPFSAGGSADIFARSFSQRSNLGQPIVVENVPGATGGIGLARAAKSAPDGYTLSMGATSTFVISPQFNSNLAYDPIRDFEPIAIMAQIQNVLVVNESLKVGSVKELVALAKAHPGKLNFASLGNGSMHHLHGEVLKKTAGIDIVHVPYKGNPQALTALLTGEVHLFFFPAFVDARAHLDGGKLRALGVSNVSRSAVAPAVPTLREQGFDIVLPTWHMLVAPAGTPAPIVQRLADELHRVNRLPDMKELLVKQGAEPNTMPPAELKKYLAEEFKRYARIATEIGLKP